MNKCNPIPVRELTFCFINIFMDNIQHMPQDALRITLTLHVLLEF